MKAQLTSKEHRRRSYFDKEKSYIYGWAAERYSGVVSLPPGHPDDPDKALALAQAELDMYTHNNEVCTPTSQIPRNSKTNMATTDGVGPLCGD
jgi:hypothetical protein